MPRIVKLFARLRTTGSHTFTLTLAPHSAKMIRTTGIPGLREHTNEVAILAPSDAMLHHGVFVPTPIVPADYAETIHLFNISTEPFYVKDGDELVQAVLISFRETFNFEQIRPISETPQ